MDIKICITSNKSFSQQTYPVLIPSLLNSGIHPSSIYFIEGGHYTRTIESKDGINYIKTNHNSVEYTSLIDIVEYSMEAEYWFMLHDTCRVGPGFATLMTNIPEEAEKVALKTFPSMSIGAYKYTYLKKHMDRLMAIKNTDYSREAIQKWKQWGIYQEDFMLWCEKTTHCHLYNEHLTLPTQFQVINEPPWYVSTITRQIEYYPQLDIYKSKANWFPKPWMEIDV